MPIKKITCHVVAAPVARPFTSSRGWLYKTRGTCLVEIETDDGIVGWGECYGPSAVAKAFIDTQLAPRVIGRDPFDVEVIWEDLYNRIKDYGTKGMAISAISGIDIALWDIIGKACNKPVHKLIGGAFRTEVDPLRHRPLLHRHGPAGRGGGRGSARLCQERRLPRDQDEDRPGLTSSSTSSASRRCARRSAPTSS